MGWFSSLFSSADSSQRTRKTQTLSYTNEAFSLPTSSPVFGSHPEAFTPGALNTPDPESAISPSYTYPPQHKGTYGYIASPLGASRQGSSSLLPTHMDSLRSPMSPNSLYPPLSVTWDRLRVWLQREYPELGDTLNYGILPQDLADIELQLGMALPPAVRESYLCVDGQEPESAAGCSEGLFFGLSLLPLESVLEEWRFWREVDDDSTTGANPKLLELMQSIPPRWIRSEYSNRGWIPLIADKAGNYIGIDMNPAEEGSVGQVIIFGRDFDTKVVLWSGDGPGGWGKWLAAFAEELESGEGFDIGLGDNSEGSEDDVGYESYFHDGTGHGAGDGGGDSGARGGLRFTGEYRGWSVLEAWGDRSLRKWHEAGLLPEYSVQSGEFDRSTKDSVGLGVVDLVHGAGVEVPIPVLSENETIPPPPVQATSTSTTQHTRSATATIPTISITKAPAPRPVGLPTQQDIDPAEHEDSLRSSQDYDLESGRGHPGVESLEEVGLVSSSRQGYQRQQSSILRESSELDSILPLSPPPQLDTSAVSLSSVTSGPSSSSTPTASSPATIIPDLMTESTPSLHQVPIQPSTTSTQLNGATTDDSSGSESSDSELSESDSGPSIRLVGSGGTTGPASENSVTNDTSDVSVADSVNSSGGSNSKTHRTTKSVLKNLGEARRKDSTASSKGVKDATSDAVAA
ncbi:hypothetical protein FA15DRAFT_666502 [Coprinopsis marcescibilis]|uniref:Knr4/Smi1-like domain-containing protein n=1 Tax=Coprinopsis marcescibilis TaxID=230819 RepID=A0A5C3L4A9_COPMA|nr:hypothetical protein FA15DRAFT_666502 [Coprinopsis marcescibilis]